MEELFTQFDYWGAVRLTLWLTLTSAVGALVIGTVVAVMRVSPVPVLRGAGAAYVNIIRNTPLTLIVVFCLLGLRYGMGIGLADPDATTSIDDNIVRWAIIGLSVYHAAFVCEAIRSGVNTVPDGQAEAARSIGLGFTASLRHVVMPQALRGAIAPIGSVMIALTKNTTVASAIGAAELAGFMKTAQELRADLTTPIFVLVALTFVAITLPMGMAFTSASRRLAVKR
ncbi:amino acid ABC transporter permease [Janibacter sp. GS2]|uniref:amino acid ABC transporter permease n=1 Tax=Janibacter sp. GS2 TaxID=3442646 RepID=UPI003EB75525